MAARRIVVSYSEIDTLRQCPLKHLLAYKERWVAPGGGGSEASDKGTEWHLVAQAHYGAIRDAQPEGRPRRPTDAQWMVTLAKARIAAQKVIPTLEHADLIQWMYDGYVERWGKADQNWWVVGVEDRSEIVLPNPAGGASKFILKTRIDLIVRDLTQPGYPIYIVDHKSSKDLPSNRELDLDDQFGLYEVLMRLAGDKVLGTVYNAIRTQRNQADFPGYSGKSVAQTLDGRHKRHRMKRPDVELRQIAVEAYYAAEWAYSPVLDRKRFSSPDPRQCGWKCDYVDQHIAARKIGVHPREILARTGFTQNFERH